MLIKFFIELAHLATGAFSYSESDVILGLLTLVDLTLTGSLLIIVIFSGYENFVSKMDHSDHSDRPRWRYDRIVGQPIMLQKVRRLRRHGPSAFESFCQSCFGPATLEQLSFC